MSGDCQWPDRPPRQKACAVVVTVYDIAGEVVVVDERDVEEAVGCS